MTLAPRRTPLEFSDLEGVAAAIRDGGGRLTAARRIVLEALFAADGPVAAEYIADGLDGRVVRSDVSSVYRNLERLEELGVVRHVHIGHGPGLYMLESATQREHLVCERCDRVDTVDSAQMAEVRAQIRRAFGYEARFSHFPIVGLCPGCAREEVPAGEADHAHRHAHAPGTAVHAHAHAAPARDQVEHLHEHSHGDHVHAHGHVHQRDLSDDHEHRH
ncbi:MAG: transcriptional repressor [Actinomycetota bacterium]|nr:transcriptional repressor [Actinomycetota bacterium]